MKRYESYKESGIPWLGEVPEHWEVKHSNQIFKIHNGATPKTSEPDYWGDEITWFTPKDLGDNNHKEISQSLKMITELGYQNCGVSLAPAKSIVLSKRAPIGHLAITTIPSVVNQGCFLLEVFQQYDVNYLYYWLYANKSVLNSFGQGSTFMELPREKFAMLKISIPPLEEQTAIAHYLDTQLGEIDALINKQQTLLEKLAEQRTATITQAVTKGLNPNVAMKNSGVEWLGDVPEHWEVKRLKFLGDIILGLTYSPENITNEDNGILVLRSSNIQNGKLVFDDNVFVNLDIPKKLITTEQDILICSRNGSRSLIGKCALIEKNGLNQSFGAFMTVYRTPYRKFIYYTLNSEIFKSQLGLFLTSTINQLTTQVLGNFNIAFPPLKEQTTIADYLDKETAKIDRLCDTVNQTISCLKEYRTALITQAVTGKIKVI